MSAILAVFTGPYALFARWAVIGLLAIALIAFGWFKGNEHGTAKLTEYIGKQAKEAVRINAAREKVTTQVVTKYVQVAAKTKTVTEYVDREVTKYAEANPGYTLDAAWGRLYDAAAANTIPDPTRGADGPERAPTAAGALEAVTDSFAACHRTADRLDALQDWIRHQQGVR